MKTLAVVIELGRRSVRQTFRRPQLMAPLLIIPTLLLKKDFAERFETGITPERLRTLTHASRVLDELLNEAPNRHAPPLAALATGEMWYRKGGERHYAFIDGGFAEVLPDQVSILAQVAEKAEDIDVARAEAARRRAEEALAKATVADFDAERARIALLRAITRLQISRQTRPRR